MLNRFSICAAVILTVILVGCASGPEGSQVDVDAAREAADEAKAAADEVFAVKTAPDEYAMAKSEYDAAMAAQEDKDLQAALIAYEAAEMNFMDATAKTNEAKKAALDAIKVMDSSIIKVESSADEALKLAQEGE